MKEQIANCINRVKSLTEEIQEVKYRWEVLEHQRTELMERELKPLLEQSGLDEAHFKVGETTHKLLLKTEVRASVSYENGKQVAPILERISGKPLKWTYNLSSDNPQVVENLVADLGGQAKPDIAWQTLTKYVAEALSKEELTREEQELLKVTVKTNVVIK